MRLYYPTRISLEILDCRKLVYRLINILSSSMTKPTRSSALDIITKVSFKPKYLLYLIIHLITAVDNLIFGSEM